MPLYHSHTLLSYIVIQDKNIRQNKDSIKDRRYYTRIVIQMGMCDQSWLTRNHDFVINDFVHISVEHQIIHYIKFSRGRTKSRILHVAKMEEGESPHSSSSKIKLIASMVVEKYVSWSSSIWTSKVGKIMKQFYCFFYEQRRGEIQVSPV